MFDDQRSVASRDGGNAAACCVDLRFTAAERAGDIVERSACALSDLIASREVSCAEVAAAYLDHIERTNPTYNAIVSLRERDDILAEAREKDELLRRGIRQGWLHGFPLAIKDLAPTKGLRTTLGSPLHRDWVPNRDARFVKQMKQSGAVLIGKTNTAEFGLGSQTFNPVFGTTLNAYDVSRTAGGSSGGAAVALATRMLPVADGSDNAGSIRNPAAYSNTFALRPTQGFMPPEGRDMHLPSLGTIGPMARLVDDLGAGRRRSDSAALRSAERGLFRRAVALRFQKRADRLARRPRRLSAVRAGRYRSLRAGARVICGNWLSRRAGALRISARSSGPTGSSFARGSPADRLLRATPIRPNAC
jgi:Asp-tRNA(Asn)/Glu-tRNA(Gln) amidotransferase A subunit family amidase